MASLQQMVEEFCSRAVLFSQPSANGSSTNSVKAHESFFDSFRRQPFAYEACLTVLDSFSARPTVPTTPQLPTAANCSSNSYSYCNSYINSNSERRKHPAAILAAQALVWITKKRSLTENEVNQLVQIVTSYSGDGVSGPVVPQLCLALGYCIVQLLSAMPPEEAEVLLLKVVQLFLSGGDSSCWCCIATLAAIAEAVSSNTSLIGLSAICSVLQLSGFVAHTLQLCLERSVSVVSNTEWLVLLLGTSSKWIQLIVEVAESSDGKGLTQLIHPLPTAWARSDLLQKARQWMLGVFSNGLCISDGQAELVSVITDTICALSRSFEILGHERIRNTSERLQLTSCIVAALEQTCSNTADTNLESLELSASTFSMAAVAGAVFSNEKPEMMRDICEYTAELLDLLRGVLLVVIPTIPQAETDADLDSAKQLIRLLYEGTQPLLLSAVYLNYDIDGPNSSIGEKWLSYHYTLTDFLGSVVQHANVSAPGDSWEEFLKDTMHWILPQWLSLAKLCNYSELTNKHILINSAKSPELQHFVESMATLLSIYLQKEYPSMIESVIASAINASAFREIAVSITEKTHSWTEEYQERFGEYRRYLRDIMRDFVNIIPGLYVWLLGHACHCCEQWRETVSILSQTLERLADAPNLLGWASAEAVLHTLSSIAKVLPKQYSVENAETNSQLVSMLTVLVKLLIDQSCAMCRPIARIGSVLLPEAIGIIISHGRSMEKSVVDVLVYESLLSLMYFSVYHSEVVVDPIERAAALRLELSTCKVSIDNIQITLALQLWHLPFRVKQDHIGAVSLSRLLQFLLVNEYVFLTDGASKAVSSVSVTSTSSILLRNMNTSDYSSVTLSKLALLKVLQFNQLEYRNSINNGRGKYQSIATMLLLFCNYYNFLDRHQPRRLPLSVESFRLIFHSMGLATFLLDRCYSSVYPIDSQLWSCDTLVEVVGINLSSIFVKLCSTNLVDGAQSEKPLRNFFSKALVNAVPNALLESVQYISLAWTEAPVSSTQLISMLNELLINYASYVKLSSAANQLLVVVDGLLPAIEILINLQLTFSSGTELVVISTDDSPPEIAIQLLLGTVIACNKTLITIFCSTVESNSLSNSQHEVINRIVLQSYSIIGNVAQLCLANSNNIEPIIRTGSTVVEAARAVMRSLSYHLRNSLPVNLVEELSRIYQRMFEEISNCGIGLVQRQQQAANHKAESLKKQSTVSMKLFRESNRKMKLLEEREGHACLTELLEFWALCLCASELITAKNIVCTNAKSGKSNQSFHDASDSQEKYMEKHGLVVVSEGSKNKETKIHVTELPLNCLGQSNLLAIIGCVCSTVMALRDSYKDYLSVKSSSCPSDVYNRLQNSLLPISLWRKVIQVLTVIQGPVHEDGFNSRDLACMTPDGCLTIAASKVIKCQDQARGLPQLLEFFALSGQRNLMVDCLMFALIATNRKVLLPDNPKGVALFPTDLREDVIRSIQKIFVCWGALQAATTAADSLCNLLPILKTSKDVSDDEVSSALKSRVLSLLTQAQACALAADWKRFHATMKGIAAL